MGVTLVQRSRIGQGLDRDWSGIGQGLVRGLVRDWPGIGQGLVSAYINVPLRVVLFEITDIPKVALFPT